MANGTTATSQPTDQPFFDTTAYGIGPDDSVTDHTEGAAITHHVAVVGGKSIAYTATAGHLVTVDSSSSLPAAKIFYVAFTADATAPAARPVTFFYNGGPGSSSVGFCSARLHRDASRPRCPDLRRPRPTRSKTIRTLYWTGAIWFS